MQGLHALVQEIEQTVDYMPQDVQGALLTPLADLHSQLCGLVYVAWLLSFLHPHADDVTSSYKAVEMRLCRNMMSPPFSILLFGSSGTVWQLPPTTS